MSKIKLFIMRNMNIYLPLKSQCLCQYLQNPILQVRVYSEIRRIPFWIILNFELLLLKMSNASIAWHLREIQLPSISLQQSVTGKINYNTTKTFHLCFWCFIPFSFVVTAHCIYLQVLYEHSDNCPAGHTCYVTV